MLRLYKKKKNKYINGKKLFNYMNVDLEKKLNKINIYIFLRFFCLLINQESQFKRGGFVFCLWSEKVVEEF